MVKHVPNVATMIVCHRAFRLLQGSQRIARIFRCVLVLPLLTIGCPAARAGIELSFGEIRSSTSFASLTSGDSLSFSDFSVTQGAGFTVISQSQRTQGICSGCSLGFQTGLLTASQPGSSTFAGGGSLSLATFDQVDVYPPVGSDCAALGLSPNLEGGAGCPVGSSLFSDGTFAGPVTLTSTAQGFQVTGPVLFTINAELARIAGIPDGQYNGNLDMTLDVSSSNVITDYRWSVGAGPGAISAPEPGSMSLLFAVVLVCAGSTYFRNRRTESRTIPRVNA